MFQSAAEILVRAANLLALAAAAPLLSPEPPPPASPQVEALLALAVLGLVVGGAQRFRTRVKGRDADAGAAALVVAVIVSLGAAAYYRGPNAPLGRGVLLVAAPLWVGLAVIAGAVAERALVASIDSRRLAAALAVLAAGAGMLGSQSRWLRDPKQMWWQAIRKDGGNMVAVDHVLDAHRHPRDPRAMIDVLDRCLIESPGACACLAQRAQLGVLMGAAEQALKDGRAAAATCANDPNARTALIAALAYHGDAQEAENEAKRAIAQNDDPRYHHGLALAYERQGKAADALAEAKKAVDGNAGRNAALLLGALAIRANELDTAQKALAPLVAADPLDAEAQYDLALVADRRSQYNPARQGYLAALKADPKMADARYNLVLLTLRSGVLEEAKHHAQRFAEIAPGDARNALLAQQIAKAAAAQPRK